MDPRNSPRFACISLNFPRKTNLYTRPLVVEVGNDQSLLLHEIAGPTPNESKELANSQQNTAMASLKVFVDMMSQPSRSVVMLLKANNVPFTLKLINIAKGDLNMTMI